MSKDANAYTHAHAEVERLKEEEKNGEQNSGNYGNQDRRRKQIKVVSRSRSNHH